MSSQNTLWNGLTYDETLSKIFYHTLETVATPTGSSTFQPSLVNGFDPTQYLQAGQTQLTGVTSLSGLFTNMQASMQAQYDALNLGIPSPQPARSLDDFLAQFNSFNLPSSWQNFVNALVTYSTPVLPKNAPANTQVSSVITNAQLQTVLDSFVADYKFALRFPTGFSGGTGVGSSEWDSIIRGIANQITTSPDGIPTDTDLQTAYTYLNNSMVSQFQSAFTDYLRSYPYTQLSTGGQQPVVSADLGVNFEKYLIASATLQPGTFPADPTPTSGVSYGPAYQSYQSIYQSYFPPSANDLSSSTSPYNLAYQNLLNQFLNQQIPNFNTTVQAGGTVAEAFVPSRLFSEWAAFVKKNFQGALSSSSIPSASIAPLIAEQIQGLFTEISTSQTVSWLPTSLTNALPAQNLTQDLSNQIQYAYYQLDPNGNGLLPPNPSIPQSIVNAALYIRQVVQTSGVSVAQALSDLSTTNLSALPAQAVVILAALGVNTTQQISPYQLSLLQYAYSNPNDPTIPTSVLTVLAAIQQRGTQTVLQNILPSTPTNLWVGNIVGSPVGSGGASSVDLDGSGRKTSILDNIFLLIVQMIGTLQNVAAAQSQRLTFLSQWQNAYVSLQNQIHSFYKGNGDYIDGSGNKDQDAIFSKDWFPKGADSAGCGDLRRSNNVRDALNNTINANLTQVIQNNRGQVSDTSKAMQSSVNATSDAVNQQSNMASTIIQQLQTLLNAIFK